MNLKDVLKPTKKYTIAKFSKKGFLEAQTFVLAHVAMKEVDHEVKYTLVKTGSVHELKWEKFIVLPYHEQFIIWEGKQKVNTAIMVTRGVLDIGQSHSITEKRWPTFDPRYLIRAKQALVAHPVAEYIASLQPEILLNYQCISS